MTSEREVITDKKHNIFTFYEIYNRSFQRILIKWNVYQKNIINWT